MTLKEGFSYFKGEMHCEAVPLAKISQDVGTPCYVYSSSLLNQNCSAIIQAFSDYPTEVCFALKANSNPILLKNIFRHGLGADIVSIGELRIALSSGALAEDIVFSGVGKTDREIIEAIKAEILSLHIESEEELDRITAIVKQNNLSIGVGLRVNPNLDPKTNPKITTGLYETKFGIAERDVLFLARKIASEGVLQLIGISCHLGSQICDLKVFINASMRMSVVARSILDLGIKLKYIDLGGGVGISYTNEKTIEIEEYAKAIVEPVRKLGLKLMIEPGRVIIANTAVLLAKVIGEKKNPLKKFIILDAGMNDFIRPALYQAVHKIEPVRLLNDEQKNNSYEKVDVVGPICESSDCFAKDLVLPSLHAGDLVCIKDTGAYGYSMASTYNSRELPCEVLVSGDSYEVIRFSRLR